MHHFIYKNNELYCEDVPVARIAEEAGTPFYLYSYSTLQRHFRAFDNAFNDVDHLTCFSMKSNSNQAILKLFANEGGGVDIVSGGELYRALRAGVNPRKIVYSGVGKRIDELEYALKSDILIFNIESEQELAALNAAAGRVGRKARIAYRVNPDVDPQTHPYISTGLKENKFGIDINDAVSLYVKASSLENIDVYGVSCHIGSQLTQVRPFVDALNKVKRLIEELRGFDIRIRSLDIGGGVGIQYDKENPPLPDEYAGAIKKEIRGFSDMTLILEPGRVIVGNAGVLITKVVYTKQTADKTFYIVDAAMNDLARPSLYNSHHGVKPVKPNGKGMVTADIVGPICESGDFLAKSREMEKLDQNDLVALMSAGAYGFSMSSNYNSRPRVCEIMVRGDSFYTIRERETYEDLIRGEILPDFLQG